MTIAVAVSGGIDSMVALHLLKADGHDVFAIHFVTGYEQDSHHHSQKIIQSHLKQSNIDFQSVDISQDFQSKVVNYFVSTYASGKTPNPCVICNKTIKFELLASHAFKSGAHFLATGHYAQVEKKSDQYLLKKGADPQKDQSYFLSMLSSEQLSKAIFPLGTWLKKDVLKYAQENGITAISLPESQEVCFIKDRYSNFLIQTGTIKNMQGPIKTTSGKEIGSHHGLHNYTVGQRKGINCPASYPYYVVRLEQKTNTLIVGQKSELMCESCHINDINWIQAPPEQSIWIDIKIRYKTPTVLAKLHPINKNQAKVTFQSSQSAITPGQIAVFYQGNSVIGAGEIN